MVSWLDASACVRRPATVNAEHYPVASLIRKDEAHTASGLWLMQTQAAGELGGASRKQAG
eukprot:CAMPEP_0175900776 /NCGR_PEP_ID=MMETSP0108-20121206/2512_1 /TAXON_ID=195067 ORGANISM="Goniomonas pacifica, Strain CCMP1869" /NCGR_SAMPLE_ID=MMETSP0108 /ASSEMBLY_ACC=CAM_ASM_000204 /LENGTH=59 /DNA_ID=CAMNT_0017222321 /DNA_START=394 /DNA_END=573 /DNA_ORIENTATION=-